MFYFPRAAQKKGILVHLLHPAAQQGNIENTGIRRFIPVAGIQDEVDRQIDFLGLQFAKLFNQVDMPLKVHPVVK